MWKISAVVIASLAGACVVVDEPAGEPESVSLSVPVGEVEEVALSEDEVELADFGGRPPREDCTANVQACLSSGLGSVPGGRPGHSRCSDCLDICQRQSYWPDRTWDGKDCQWWSY